MTTRRAWLALGAGILVYLVAVLQRTSFAVAGIDATARFHASASIVATFVVIQLAVYALMQVPAGGSSSTGSAPGSWWRPARSSWRPVSCSSRTPTRCRPRSWPGSWSGAATR